MRYLAARDELVEAGLIQVDEDAGYELIERWFKHNGPMNGSHLKGIISELERCGSVPLRDHCVAALEQVWLEKSATKPIGETCKSGLPPMTPDMKPPRLQGVPRRTT